MDGTTTGPAGAGSEARNFLGHPRGLVVLFFAEMWERFSYYGMKALLVFYLTQHFLFADDPAFAIIGAYTSLVYLTPLLGGYMADRWLGYRRAVILGGVLIMLGHIGMAFEGQAASYTADGTLIRDGNSLQIFYLALALIIVGTGLLKPNISTIVGALYEPGDARRDGGFTIYYMGINIGALAAPLLCGWLGHTYGWSYGFGAAAVGMAAGLIVFVLGRSWLDGRGEPHDPEGLRRPMLAGLKAGHVITLATVASVLPLWWLVQNSHVVGTLLIGVAAVSIGGVAYYAVRNLEHVDRDRILAILVLTGLATLFFAFFEQTGTSISLFAERAVDLTLMGMAVAPAQIQAINPMFIILCAPLFALGWVWLARANAEPNIPVKFALGLVQIGIGFFMFIVGIELAQEGHRVGFAWLVLGYLFHTTGELCLSPVGLSAVTKLAPPRMTSLMMGIWFLSSAFANYAAALIAMTASVDEPPGTDVPVAVALPVYEATFSSIAWVGVGAGLAALLVSPLIKRLMHGVR
ncbi:MAG: peptide MFS transporter [Alphaproteobacteria bacterium]